MSGTSANRSVIFICTGNMCRSPFAEAVMRRLGAGGIEASSMGLSALPGNPASTVARRVAPRFGVDLSSHRTRPLDGDRLQSANGIYVFEHMHRANIEALFPAVAPRVRLLGSLLQRPDDEIPDPLGTNEESVVRCFETIVQACKALIGRDW